MENKNNEIKADPFILILQSLTDIESKTDATLDSIIKLRTNLEGKDKQEVIDDVLKDIERNKERLNKNLKHRFLALSKDDNQPL